MGQVAASFYEMVFSLCRAPFTGSLTDVFETWQRYEGGDAINNPLNVEVRMPGSRDYNAVGVQDYVSAASGASATAQTLLNGRYPAIVAAMRANTPIDSWSRTPIPAEIDTWGTTGFATYLRSLTPAQEGQMTPQQAQMLMDIWLSIFAPTAPDGSAPWNNIEIIRRQNAQLGADYNLHPGPIPGPIAPKS